MRRPLRPRGYKCAICQQFRALLTLQPPRSFLIMIALCIMKQAAAQEKLKERGFFRVKWRKKEQFIPEFLEIFQRVLFLSFFTICSFCDVRTQSKRAFIAFGLKRNTQCIISTKNQSLLKIEVFNLILYFFWQFFEQLLLTFGGHIFGLNN